MSLTKSDLDLLKKPFDEKTICVKVQSVSKQKDKAGLVLYVQHTDVYSRIEEVDPAWSAEVTSEKYFGPTENANEYFTVRVKLTVKGVSRENSGEGQDQKSANSDAIKRAAMLFGVGRYLYDTETVWVPYNQDRDYYKTFTIGEYMAALRQGQYRPPIGNSAAASSPKAPANQGPAPAVNGAIRPPSGGAAPIVAMDGKARAQLGVQILEAGKRLRMTGPQVADYVQETMGKPTAQLSVEEMQAVLSNMQFEIGRNGG